MIRRSLLLLLAFAIPLVASDVPISARPLAPIPGVGYVVASAAPEAVLVVFVASADVYAQRFALDGRPLDATATYLGSSQYYSPIAEVAWDGRRWIVLWNDGAEAPRVVYVEPSGAVDGPHELPVRQLGRLIVLGERVVVSASATSSRPGTSRRIFFELTPPNSLDLLSSIDLIGNDLRGGWTIGLDEGPGLVAYVLRFVRSTFDGTVFIHRPDGHTKPIEIKTSAPSIVSFTARREGGGLLVWSEDGLQGIVIGSDGSISQSFPIGPRGKIGDRILTDAHAGGWDIVFSLGPDTWLARIDVGGRVSSSPVERGVTPPYLNGALVAAGEGDLLFERGSIAGIAVRRITQEQAGEEIAAGVGGAAQFRARAAAGEGVELVVWEEQSSAGTVLKATRVAPNGAPLDGPGLLIADESRTHWIWPSYRSAFDVAFDGEAFVIAWVRDDERDTVMMRRVWGDGSVSATLGLAVWDQVEGVSVAGTGRGRSAVAWSGFEERRWSAESSPLSVLVPINQGRTGTAVEVGSGNLGWAVPNLAASGDRYLGLFNDSAPCQITCQHYERPYARLFTLDGAPLTEARRISDRITGPAVPEVVSDGRDFFVAWNDTLVAIDPELAARDEKPLASGGSLSIEGRELRIDRGKTRLVYSAAGELLRLEPLPDQYAPSEARIAALRHNRFIMRVRAHPDALVIRSLDEPQRSADLAVVATGEITPSSTSSPSIGFYATFRIEHRGGAPVHAIDLWSDDLIFGVPDLPKGFDVDLEAGESITVEVGIPRDNFGGSLWVAGDVVDSLPANNVDSVGPRLKRRTVSR
jgi:hypothetical protein